MRENKINKILSFLCLAGLMLGGFSGGAIAQQKISQNSDEGAAIEILEKNVAALGGRDAFAAIKSIEMEVERQVLGRTIKTRRIVDIVGNRSYNRQEGGNGIIESGFDGKKAWQKAPFFRGYLDANSQQAKALSRVAAGLPGTSLYNYKPQSGKFARLPDEQLDGKNLLVVKSIRTDESGKEIPVKFYFDPTSFLLKRTVSGDAVKQTEIYDDYRKIDGITIAFASTVTNTQATINSKITALKFNAPVNAAIFEFQEASSQDTTTSTNATNPVLDSGKTDNKVAPLRVETAAELGEELRLEAFETVWKTINDTFYDRTFNGVDWQVVHEKYLPQVKAAAKSDDYHKLLNRMVQELRLSHFKIVPPQSVVTLSSGTTNPRNGSPRLGVRWVENQLLVSNVGKDSPAALAGIRPGFAIRRINGKTPDELYEQYKKDNPGFQFREELARVRAVGGEMVGKPDSKVALEMLDARDNPVKVELPRQVAPLARELVFESKKLDGNVGYIRFNLFFGDLLPKFQAALETFRNTKSLIIDLRGNPGGAGDLAPALANLLFVEPGSLGSLKYRYETTQYSYKGSGEKAYQGKVIILIDEGTGSTSEVFAGGLQANKRAVIIGSQSAGAVLPSMVKLLPTGGALQYVVSSFLTSNGIMLEGRGVTPDLTVKLSRADLLADRDPVLERAMTFSEQSK